MAGPADEDPSSRPPGISRRELLSAASAVAAAGALPAAAAKAAARDGKEKLPERLRRAREVREAATSAALAPGLPESTPNGDELSIPDRLACFSKGLPHDRDGRVDPRAWDVLARALESGAPADFEVVPLGGFARLANPQSAWTYALIGPDPAQVACPPAPRFASEEQAAEMVELYWQAALRDVPFSAYSEHPLAAAAAAELSAQPGFRGPRRGEAVTPRELFRGTSAGDLAGPYLSQFLLKPIPFTPITIDQKIRTAAKDLDYLTADGPWLAIQNGQLAGVNQFASAPSYITNGRDLGEYVHRDFSYQPYLAACLQALKWGTQVDGGNPYKHSRTQSAFTTFGLPYLLGLLATVTQSALGACWYQKWRVHRRLRPEEYGGRVAAQLAGRLDLPIPRSLLESRALAETRRRGSALLPQAYPEGCPIHPSYPAGHAAIAGACVTALKACLDESHQIPEPVEPAPDGRTLVRFGGTLTLGDELDKLAANVSIGRNFAGIHYRSDAAAGLLQGEEVAIRILAEMKLTGGEIFSGFSLRKFDGRRIEI